MIYGSLCSGIEAATAAWRPLGWRPAFYAEIEKFPSALLAHHYPEIPNHGDITAFAQWPDYAINVLVGGTPCQAFSLSGFRKGLDDPRGHLTLTYLAVAARYRPNWLVWENVPGVLSSGGGRDFGALLGGLGQLGYGFAFRVLNAQYFGIPQQRRRVFVVGYSGNWRPAAAVLFERESFAGCASTRGPARQNIEPADDAGAKDDDADPIVSNAEGTTGLPFLTRSNIGKHINNQSPLVSHCGRVRRLTPRECERLQGFRDDYSLVPFSGRPAADGLRYKALGDSMAVPVMEWLGRRIALVESIVNKQAAPPDSPLLRDLAPAYTWPSAPPKNYQILTTL